MAAEEKEQEKVGGEARSVEKEREVAGDGAGEKETASNKIKEVEEEEAGDDMEEENAGDDVEEENAKEESK